MNQGVYSKLGLSDPQVSVYKALLEKGTMTVTQIATASGESRTNTYVLLNKLIELQLVGEDGSQPTLRYFANNPTALEQLADTRQQEASDAKNAVQQNMSSLLSQFYSASERPGVRLFEGKDALAEIYEDVLVVCDDVIVLRTPDDTRVMSGKFYLDFKKAKHRAGIKTHMISPNINTEKTDYDLDEQLGIKRTILPDNVYNEPVEISVYGDKVAMVSFGNETIGIVMQSPLISAAMRTLLTLFASLGVARKH